MLKKILKRNKRPEAKPNAAPTANKDNLLDVRKKMMVGFTLALAGAFVIAVAALWPSGSDSKTNQRASVAVVDTCAKENTATFTCYKKLLTDIIDEQSPKEAVALIKKQSETVPYIKSQCHQLTHVSGRAAYAKYGNLAETFKNGDHYCASGYFHGASEEIVASKGSDYMSKNASTICKTFAEKEPYLLDHYNCVHGLGHGLMEAEKGELIKALNACDTLKDPWERESCYSGVFMQNIMIAQSPDQQKAYIPKYLKKSEPMYPCTSVDEKYRSGCYIIQTSWALPQVNYDYGKVFAMCAEAGAHSVICYQSLGRDATGLQAYNLEQAKKTCDLGTSYDARSNCVIGAAKDVVYNYHADTQAYQFCGILSADLQNSCNLAVKDYYSTF